MVHLALLAVFVAVLFVFLWLLRLLIVDGARSLPAAIACSWRQQHDPVRHFLGGFRCASCGTSAATLEEMGFDGQLPGLHRIHSRDERSIEQTSEWAQKAWKGGKACV